MGRLYACSAQRVALARLAVPSSCTRSVASNHPPHRLRHHLRNRPAIMCTKNMKRSKSFWLGGLVCCERQALDSAPPPPPHCHLGSAFRPLLFPPSPPPLPLLPLFRRHLPASLASESPLGNPPVPQQQPPFLPSAVASLPGHPENSRLTFTFHAEYRHLLFTLGFRVAHLVREGFNLVLKAACQQEIMWPGNRRGT